MLITISADFAASFGVFAIVAPFASNLVRGNTIISNAIDEDIRAGILVKLFPDYQVTATDFNTAAWLLYPSRAYIPLKVRMFVEELRKYILMG